MNAWRVTLERRAVLEPAPADTSTAAVVAATEVTLDPDESGASVRRIAART